MNRNTHLLYLVVSIVSDDIMALNLESAANDAPFPLNAAMRRGRAALRDSINAQIAELRRTGGLPYLRWTQE